MKLTAEKSQSPLPATTRSANKKASSLQQTSASASVRCVDAKSDKSTVTLTELATKLDYLVSKMDKMENVLEKIGSLETQVESVTGENVFLKNRIAELERKMEDLESTRRGCHLMLSGREISQLPSTGDLRKPVTDLLNRTTNYSLSPTDMLSTHRIGRSTPSQTPDRRSIKVKLSNSDIKNDLLLSCKRTRPDGLFINEDLIPTRSGILFSLRQAKKRFPHKIAGHGSLNGRVYVLLPPPDPSARAQRLFINDQHKLGEFCARELGVPSSEFSAVRGSD